MASAPRRALLDTAQLRHVIDSGIVGIVLWDADGRIHDANDRFLEIVGYDREELESGGLDWRKLTPPEWHAADSSAIAEIERGGTAGPVEKEYVKRDGTRAPVLLRSTAIDDARIVSIVADIGERKRADLEKAALHERERVAREEAQAAVDARDDILAIVSHDLRNPLQTLAISVAALAHLGGERATPVAARAQRAITGMERLIRDLLEVNQIASGRLVVEPVPTEAGTLLEEAASMAASLVETKGQKLHVEAEENLQCVAADRVRVGQVFSNLVGNSVKFTPEGGQIRLRAARRNGEIEFQVCDSGPGIAAGDLPYIFERFWQARRVRRGGGVGLGLAISHGIVAAHGGHIRAESEPGIGTTFSFTLPIASCGPAA